jgi:hypothetical protein
MTKQQPSLLTLPNLALGVLCVALILAFLSWIMINPADTAVQLNLPEDTHQVTSSPSPSPVAHETKTLKVFSLAYFPLRENRLDTVEVIEDGYNEYNYTLPEIRSRVSEIEKQLIVPLERATKYTAADGSSVNYIDYQVVKYQEFLEAVPLSKNTYNNLPLPDYKSMMSRVNICDLVDKQDIREVWLWTYGGTGKSGWTSNFSSKFGDISNSDMSVNDLPICQHSYTVYDYNYGRTVVEALHNHTLQYEALFGYLDYEFFWKEFAGRDTFTGVMKHTNPAGCGWTNMPPNAVRNFEYASNAKVESTCQQFLLQPDLAQSSILTCKAWGCDHYGYLTWWMDHIPGYTARTYQGKRFRNWWEFVADFDQAMIKGKDLFE